MREWLGVGIIEETSSARRMSGESRREGKIDIKKNPKPELLPSRNGIIFLLS